jgi:outer membrane protein
MWKTCGTLTLSGSIIIVLASLTMAANMENAPITPGAQLTLKEAIAISLKFHPRRHEAAAQSGAAGERVGEARAELLPQVYGTAQYLRSTANGIGNTEYYNVEGVLPRESGRNHDLPANDFSQSADTYNNYLGGIAISQFLLDFGRHLGYVEQRRFEAAAAKAHEQMVDLDLIFEVSQRYFALLAAQQMVRVYEKAVEQRQYHLHEAQVKASAALRPELDVYVTKAELERAQLRLVDARNAVADAKVALDNAMGLSEAAPQYQPADVLTYAKISETMGAVVRQAMSERPDLAAAEDQIRAMGAQIQEYRSDFLPTANAVGGYNAMSTGLPAVNNFNVGLVITWPMFNGFLTTHEVEETKLQQQALEHALEDLRQRVILQVKTAFLDWQASLDRIRRAEAAVAASSVELELAEKRYEAGLTNIVELEDAQRHYTFDDADYANALYSYSLAKSQVGFATGSSLVEVPRR